MKTLTSIEIRAARDAAGWSISQAARELKRGSREPLPEVDSLVRAWKRWERGSEPSRLYRPLLMSLFADPDTDDDSSHEREFVDVYSERSAVPRETWLGLINGANERIDVLAFAATFFHQLTVRVGDMFAAAAGRGAQVRLCFAHPESAALAIREAEERLLDASQLATKARTSLGYYRALVEREGCEVRLHRATVYASLFRFDDVLMTNPHIYGGPASANPLMQLGSESTLFSAYAESFEAVWQSATAWTGEAV
jgi:hypothetical protein